VNVAFGSKFTGYLDAQQRSREQQVAAILADSYRRSSEWVTGDLWSLTALAFMDGGTLRLLDSSMVLARPRLARSQFVFTETRGRPAIFWQTQKAARAANPGARIPRARALPEGVTILIDTRERYPYRFAGRDVKGEGMALPAGDYAVANAEATIAVVERKTLENFTTSLSDGTLAFQMQDWARSPGRRSCSRGVTPRCSASSTFPPTGALP
jgi:hypothetical protein